jgi:RNA polymerase sigma-70 factor (ECF subfamily)
MLGRSKPGSRASAGKDKSMPARRADDDGERTRRFREVALPCLDDVYTLARYLLRDADAAEDAVQECYLRALKHFDSYHGPAIKPWLFAILRNICHAEFTRRMSSPTAIAEIDNAESQEAAPLWHEAQASPEAELLRRRDATTVQRLVSTLAEPFREILVLREMQNLSYREISDIVGAPIGTVMSRLARARAMLRIAWMAEEEPHK